MSRTASRLFPPLGAAALGALVALSGCSSSDPCEGRSGACVAVTVRGQAPPLDEIDSDVHVGATTLFGLSGTLTPPARLPVQYALRLPDSASGALLIVVHGLQSGSEVASGDASLVLPARGHARVTVTLSPLGGSDLAPTDAALDLRPRPTDLPARLDGLPGTVSLSPTGLTFPTTLVSATSAASFTLANNGSGAVTITQISLPAPFYLTTTSTCHVNDVIVPGGSCRLDTEFRPSARGPASALLTVIAGATLTSTVGGKAVAWVSETLTSVPALNTVFALSTSSVYAGGDNGLLYHRNASGWSVTNPSPGFSHVLGVWAASEADLYLVQSDAFVYHSTTSGASFTSDEPLVTGNPISGAFQSVSGLSSTAVFVSSTKGEVFTGSVGTWLPDRVADSTSITGLAPVATTMFCVGGAALYQRLGPGSWSATSGTSTPLGGVWGNALNNYYFVGTLGGCVNNNCGMMYHYTTSLQSQALSGAGLTAVWGLGSSEIYAVGPGGLILRSTGNDDWTAESSGTTNNLRALWGAGGEVWAVGAAGTILHRY
jgi:hypothetical protein